MTTTTETTTTRPELTRADFDRITRDLTRRPTYLMALVEGYHSRHKMPPTVRLVADALIEAEGFSAPRSYGSDPEWFAAYSSRVGKALAKVADEYTGLVMLKAADFYAMTGSKVRAYATAEWVRQLTILRDAKAAADREAREAREAAAASRVITPAMAAALLRRDEFLQECFGDSLVADAAKVLRRLAAEAG